MKTLEMVEVEDKTHEDLKEYVRVTYMKHCDFEAMRINDIESGIGFRVTDPKGIVKDNKTPNGIFSPEYFGSTWGDENPFKEKYSCKCKALQGTIYEGITCSKCNTVVTYTDNGLDKTGWFVMDNYKVIHPVLYKVIASVIGKNDFANIITPSKCDIDGNYMPDIDNKNPYFNIGMVEFEEKFDEIIEYFMKKKHRWKAKLEEYELLKEKRNIIFTDSLPVYSLILRPVSIIGGTFQYTKVNRDLSRLSTLIYQLNRIRDAEIEYCKAIELLEKIQYYYMKVYKHSLETLAANKRSHIRGQILGARYNFTSRNVITPYNNKKRINEIKLSYLGFVELHKPEIINILTNSLGYKINDAHNVWFKATMKFDEMIYKIILSMIDSEKGVHVAINRNPS